jgi:hypothetical protein
LQKKKNSYLTSTRSTHISPGITRVVNFTPQLDPNFLDCDEPETTGHFLLHCTTLEKERLELKHYLKGNLNITFTQRAESQSRNKSQHPIRDPTPSC